MIDFKQINSQTNIEALVALYDLTSFGKLAKKISNEELFIFLDNLFELTGDVIESSGGKIIKFIGDAAIIVFPNDKIDKGIQALFELKSKSDTTFKKYELPMRMIIKAHFGNIIIGKLGTKSSKKLDIIGDTVNYTFRLQSHGFAISPELFRKLSKETRKKFKKHTPPIRYIPLEEMHKD